MTIPKSLILMVIIGLFLIQSTDVLHTPRTHANKAACQDVTTSNPTAVITKESRKILAYDVECLPTSMLYRALRHITDSQEMVSPQWSSFYFGKYVIPMYRPDIGTSKPAFYEIEIFSDVRRLKSAGFIILTNPNTTSANPNPVSRIDYPIAHWNSNDISISTYLLRKTQDKIGNVMIWKMDTLSYVATRNDQIAGQIGNMPMPLTGLTQAEFNNYSKVISSVIDTPISTVGDEKATGKFTRTMSGPNEAVVSKLFSVVQPSSFSDYVSKYTSGFKPQIDSQRLRTVTDWTYEKRIAPNESTYSIPVPENETTVIPIPFAGITSRDVAITDTKNIFSSATIVQSSTTQFPVLRLVTGARSASLKTATAKVTVDGVVKMNFTFTLIDDDTTKSVTPPVTSKSGRNHYVWHSWSAGTDAQQRMYNQFDYAIGCKVGCGGVAWMMLFGWYDYRSSAAGGSIFSRWNTFREGGIAAGNASTPAGIAPATNNAGVVTATRNIRNRISTFCAFGSGATFPWDMSGASGYLSQMQTGLAINTHYNSVGASEGRLKRYAAEEIVHRGRPAIIGTGWLSHYPLAYKYRWYTRPEAWNEGWGDGDDVTYVEQFYVNAGWGGAGNGWVSASTWFAGRATP